MGIEKNETFELASEIVCHTSRSLFLTGKAGTGKTTFLHHIKANCNKNIIVAAPTGVAAINAGGVTIHSLLQLPFEPYIPNFEGKKKLDYHLKLHRSKIEMIRELELLIIDEVSMLRADVLDAMDYMLRRYRNNTNPFGGVQMLFIGDMFQLPPVVQNHEWERLKDFYLSPFFFHAQVLNDYPLSYIELKTVYRQKDNMFIEVLNRIRHNQTRKDDLELLNQHYNPNFSPSEKENFITLCTHNYRADQINKAELSKLQYSEHTFTGQIKGDFSENSLPTENTLILKQGAQVMFIKNDSGEHRRYYNGKIAIIDKINDKTIIVRFPETGMCMEVEKESWKNIRYRFNDESGEIEEDEIGSFSQYPIKLAWAITIHKSQGLTFDNVVIDAGQAFAAGQVYVALSRCTSLDGIVLYSKLTQQSINTDQHAIEFSKREESLNTIKQILELEKPQFCANQLIKEFDWTPCIVSVQAWKSIATEKTVPEKESVLSTITEVLKDVYRLDDIAKSFQKELQKILLTPKVNIPYLEERVQKAILYFHQEIQTKIIVPLEKHILAYKNKSKVKAYLKKTNEVHDNLVKFLDKLEHITYDNIKFSADLTLKRISIEKESIKEQTSAKKGKPEKGDSKRLTLELFNSGKNIKEIALERNLSTTTIESHLADFISTKEVNIEQLIPDQKLSYMIAIIEKNIHLTSLNAFKELLPNECTYFDIKAVLNHVKTK